MRKSQAWSMELIIAVMVFMAAIFLFISILNNGDNEKPEELREDALRILGKLNITDETAQLMELSNQDYEELKRALRVGNEFCIFLEDEDGNIVFIEGKGGSQSKGGIGSNTIHVGGMPCGTGLTDAQKIVCEEAALSGSCGDLGDFGLSEQICCYFLGLCCPP